MQAIYSKKVFARYFFSAEEPSGEASRKRAATNCPVTMRKKGTATRASTLVRKKSALSLMEARGEVWIAMTRMAAATRNLSSPP